MKKHILLHCIDIGVLGLAAISAVLDDTNMALLGIVIYLTGQSITNFKGALK